MEEYKSVLFKLFGGSEQAASSNLDGYRQSCREFNSLKDKLANYLKANGVRISSRDYVLQNTTIFRDEFSEHKSSLQPIRGIELTIKGSRENVEKAAALLKGKFGLDDLESIGFMMDSMLSWMAEE
jgi:hypothetical protein